MNNYQDLKDTLNFGMKYLGEDYTETELADCLERMICETEEDREAFIQEFGSDPFIKVHAISEDDNMELDEDTKEKFLNFFWNWLLPAGAKSYLAYDEVLINGIQAAYRLPPDEEEEERIMVIENITRIRRITREEFEKMPGTLVPKKTD